MVLAAVRTMRAWQFALLAVVVIVAAGGTYLGYTMVTGTEDSPLEENQQLVPVRRGDLVDAVSINGTLVYSKRESFGFGSETAVGELLVEEGRHVEAGQVLARLEPKALASLDRAVTVARIALRSAEQALDAVRNPHSPLSVAELTSGVATARVSLRAAEEALAALKEPSVQEVAKAYSAEADAQEVWKAASEARELLLSPPSPLELTQARSAVAGAMSALREAEKARDLLLSPPSPLDLAQARSTVADAMSALREAEEARDLLLSPPSPLEVARARSAVADAEASLEAERDALNSLGNPSELDVAQAESAVASSQLSLRDAQEALDDLLDGASEKETAEAQRLVDSAELDVSTARAKLELARRDWTGRIDAARDAQDEAGDAYRRVFRKWLGIEVETGVELSPDELLESLGVELEAVFDPDAQADELKAFRRGTATGDDPSTPWSEPVVYTWLVFFPGGLVVHCEDGPASLRGVCIASEMDTSYEALRDAKDGLHNIVLERAREIGVLEKGVSDAEVLLAARREALEELKAAPDVLEVRDRRAKVALARTKLAEAEAEVAALKNGPSALELAGRMRRIGLAEATLTRLVEDLDAKADPVEYEVLERDVEVARLKLEASEDELARLLDDVDPDPVEYEVLERDVEVARLKLEASEHDLARLLDVVDPVALEAAKRRARVANAALDETQAALWEIMGDADPVDLAAGEAGVHLARARLAEAEDALAGLDTRDELEMLLREADVLTATEALEAAIAAVESATLRAPWAGLVESVEVKEGLQSGQDQFVLKLVDTTVIEVDGSIDEIDVLSVRKGSRAVVTLDALPGQAFAGEVIKIGTTAGSQESGGSPSFGFSPLGGSPQGVVTYSISVRVTAPDGLELPEGLSALAQVVIKEERDVLLVPLQTLHGSFDSPTVMVQGETGLEERPVVLGISDDFWTVVTEGLTEGETVVMDVPPARQGDYYGF